MDRESESFQPDIQKFKSIRMMLPPEMKFKLEFMLARITGEGDSVDKLTQADRRNIEDMLEVPIDSLKIIFRSLVNSILDPKLYSSFEKQCRIKVYGSHWLKEKYQWKWVYIEFHNDSLVFKKRKGAFKFTLNNLDVKFEESHGN